MRDVTVKIRDLPVLSEAERDDAVFRARDLGWAALVRLFEQHVDQEKLSYQKLGDRIKRSRSHVQRWLSSPFNLSIGSLGLLAEGLNADLRITLEPRTMDAFKNYCHPSEAAKGVIVARTVPVQVKTQQVSSFAPPLIRTSADADLTMVEA